MTPTSGIMCVPCSFMIPSSSSMLLNSPTLLTSFIVMVMKVSKHRLVVMSLGAREESFSIRLTLSFVGCFPYNNSIATIIQNLNIPRKYYKKNLKLSISQVNATSQVLYAKSLNLKYLHNCYVTLKCIMCSLN